MEFVRRNYNSSSRPLVNSSISGASSYLPPTPPTRSGRAPSVSRFTSVEREIEPSIPPPYRSREPSVSRRNSRDYSNERWSTRRDSSTFNPFNESDYLTSNKRRLDRWSTMNSPAMSSPSSNFSSLPGSIYLHVNQLHEFFHLGFCFIFVWYLFTYLQFSTITFLFVRCQSSYGWNSNME